MDINTIDDLLKYLSEYSVIWLHETTIQREKDIVKEAQSLKLVYTTDDKVYKLDELGKKVVDFRFGWKAYQDREKQKQRKSSWDADITNSIHDTINAAAIRKTGKSLKQLSRDFHSTGVYDNETFQRNVGEQILFPLAPEEKKKRSRKILDFLAHPDTKTVIQTIVWSITIIGGIFSFFKWVLPYIIQLNK